MPHHASLQILVPRRYANEPYAGEFERRRSACLVLLNRRGTKACASRFQRGVWGSERRVLWRFPPGIARQDNPQTRVLPPPGKSQPTSI